MEESWNIKRTIKKSQNNSQIWLFIYTQNFLKAFLLKKNHTLWKKDPVMDN